MASNVSNECGFDEEFVEPVGEFLKCIICHLVLRNPIQILKCGHRYCECCFNRIKSHSEQYNLPLYCPIDREEIDLKYVFSDTGMARLVDDLKVKCSFSVAGCSWVGELRDLKTHTHGCEHVFSRKRKASLNIPDEISCVLNEFRQRLSTCEETLLDKEKDIAYLKFSLQEMKKKEIEMQERDKKRKKEIEELSKEIEILKGKDCDHLEQGLIRACNEIAELRTGLKRQEECEEEITKLKDCYQTVKASVDDIGEKIEVRTIQGNSLRDSIFQLDEQMKGLQKEVKDCHCNDYHVEFENALQEIDELRAQSNHINNLLPYNNNMSFNKSTMFVWRIYNLEEIFAEKRNFNSPKFYCHHNGHICQLVGWVIIEGAIKIGFRLSKGLKGTDVATFNCNVTLELMYNDGEKKIYYLTADKIDKARERCFTLHGGGIETLGRGCHNFLVKDEMEKYINNGRCTIICKLTPVA